MAASSDPTKRPRPGPFPPVPETTAMPPSSWAKRTNFKPKFSGETDATNSGQLPVQPNPKKAPPQVDLEAGRSSAHLNGDAEANKTQIVKKRRDSVGGAAAEAAVPPPKRNSLPQARATTTTVRSDEAVLPQTVDVDDEFVSRHSHMKYELRDTPGLVPIGFYGFQHYLSILGSLILIPLVIVPAMGGSHDDTSMVVSTVLFVSGMTTLLHTSFGSRLPLIQGPSFVFLAPALAIINSPEFVGLNGNNFKHTMKELQGAIIIASAFQAIMGYSGLMTLLLRLINPVVVAPTIAAVGLSFYSYGFPQVGKCLEIGLVQILVVIIFSLYLRKISVFGHRLFLIYAVPLSLAITWATAFLLTKAGAYSYKGCDVNVPASNIISEHCRKHISRMRHCRVDTSQALKSSPWFRFPYPLQWGTPVFSWKMALVMCVVSIISSVDSVGSYHASSLLVASRPPTPGVVSRGIGLEGLASILAGLWGTGTGSTSLTENVHTIAVTKMGSRRAVEFGACVLIFLSLVGMSTPNRDYVEPAPVAMFEMGELLTWSYYRAVIAEFVATLLFLYIIVAIIIGHKKQDEPCDGVGLLGISWGVGGMIFVLVYCTAGISGGHINPAVTFGLFLARKVTLVRALGYMVAQCLGAICGVGLAKVFMKHDYNKNGGGANSIADGYSKGTALGAEIIGTFVEYHEEYIRNSRGNQLFTCRWLPFSSPKALVFLCHGYGMECSGYMKGCGNRLARYGYAVVGIDYEGHGRSMGARCYIKKFDNIVDDCSIFFKSICGQEEYRDKRKFLYGESMGGAVALLIHKRDPAFWDGAVLVAPMCKISEKVKPHPIVISMLTRVEDIIPKWKIVPTKDVIDSTFKDPVKREEIRGNRLIYQDKPRLKTALEMLRTSMNLEDSLSQVTLPFFVLHGEADTVTDPEVSQALYERASSTDKTMKLYPGMWHGLTSGEPDNNIDAVFSDIIAWLDKRSEDEFTITAEPLHKSSSDIDKINTITSSIIISEDKQQRKRSHVKYLCGWKGSRLHHRSAM